MNSLTQNINSVLRPKVALIAYKADGSNDYFLELRNIGNDGKMGEGQPVTYDFMNGLASSYYEAYNGTPHGKMPQNMLYCDTRKGNEKYVWFNAPRKRMMYFSDGLGIADDEYNVPGIIYVVSDGQLDVYAFKGKAPKENDKLYCGPFFNVTNGSVCIGSAEIKKSANPTFDQLIDYWEKKFWLTKFSHLGGGNNPTVNNLVLVTKAAKDAPFNEKELLAVKKTLNDLLR